MEDEKVMSTKDSAELGPFQHQVFYNEEVKTGPDKENTKEEAAADSGDESCSSLPAEEKCNESTLKNKVFTKVNPSSERSDFYMTLVTEDDRQLYGCVECDSQFKTLKRVLNHKKKHGASSNDPLVNQLKCQMCKKSFKTRAHLTLHMKTQHYNPKDYHCPICNKFFAQTAHLQAHMVTHTGEKKYVCDYCDKRFKQSGHLLNHRRIHTGERKFVCEICNKSFTQNIHLRSHFKTHTGEKDHQCLICQKSFMQSGHLQMHMRTHTGERKHPCQICDMKFKQSGHLQAHVKTHLRPKVEKAPRRSRRKARKAEYLEIEIPALEDSMKSETAERYPIDCIYINDDSNSGSETNQNANESKDDLEQGEIPSVSLETQSDSDDSNDGDLEHGEIINLSDDNLAGKVFPKKQSVDVSDSDSDDTVLKIMSKHAESKKRKAMQKLPTVYKIKEQNQDGEFEVYISPMQSGLDLSSTSSEGEGLGSDKGNQNVIYLNSKGQEIKRQESMPKLTIRRKRR